MGTVVNKKIYNNNNEKNRKQHDCIFHGQLISRFPEEAQGELLCVSLPSAVHNDEKAHFKYFRGQLPGCKSAGSEVVSEEKSPPVASAVTN